MNFLYASTVSLFDSNHAKRSASMKYMPNTQKGHVRSNLGTFAMHSRLHLQNPTSQVSIKATDHLNSVFKSIPAHGTSVSKALHYIPCAQHARLSTTYRTNQPERSASTRVSVKLVAAALTQTLIPASMWLVTPGQVPRQSCSATGYVSVGKDSYAERLQLSPPDESESSSARRRNRVSTVRVPRKRNWNEPLSNRVDARRFMETGTPLRVVVPRPCCKGDDKLFPSRGSPGPVRYLHASTRPVLPINSPTV